MLLDANAAVPDAARATSTIPIVFYSSADPVQLGLAASLALPGGNATGITVLLDDIASKRLELLKEAVPRVSHVAFLWNPEHPDNELSEAQRAARSLGVRLELVDMRGAGDLENAFRAVKQASWHERPSALPPPLSLARSIKRDTEISSSETGRQNPTSMVGFSHGDQNRCGKYGDIAGISSAVRFSTR